MSKFDETLDLFKKFIDIISGKANIRDRIGILLSPRNPQTSSKLKINQVDYLRNSIWIAKQYPEFEPLKEDAMELAITMLSHEGWGVDQVIRLEDAMSKEVLKETTIKEPEKQQEKGEIRQNESK
jgi:hypothetical protein